MRKFISLCMLAAALAAPSCASEFEVVDVLRVDGAALFHSSATLVAPDSVKDLLWVSTSAVTPHLYVSSSGAVGLGTADPAVRLHVAGTAGEAGTIMAVSTGSTNLFWVAGDGAHAVKFFGDGSGLTNLAGAADNLGNHTATQALDLAGFPVLGVSSLTMSGAGLLISSSIYTGASGVFISTAGSIMTQGLGNGSALPAARGLGAVDLQTARSATAHIAAGLYSVVSGGSGNRASNTSAVVSGGDNCTASGYASVVGGGQGNSASGLVAVVSGGLNNAASGNSAVAGGGRYNAVSGDYAAIPGGYGNLASGAYSFAAGFASSSTAAGAFTWADAQGVGVDNKSANRTLFKSRGGFMVTGSTNTAMAGTLDRGVLLTGDGLVGISTGVPYAALDVVSTGAAADQMTQIWRDSGGVIKASMSATGVMMAARFVGDGSGITGLPGGDNLGNHTATQTLAAGYGIAASTISASTSTFSGFINVTSTAGYAMGGSTILRSSAAYSTFVGAASGRIDVGAWSTHIGASAGWNSSGSSNSYVGAWAGGGTTGGSNNSVLGAGAGYNIRSGNSNVLLGAQAGYGVGGNWFSNVVAAGYRAGYGLTTGGDNILIGWQAGDSITSGSRNIVIGYGEDATSPTASNELNIGGLLYGNLTADTVGVNVSVQQAALDVVSTGTASNVYAQIWRNSIGIVVASMTSTGSLMASRFVGDGSGLTNLAGAGGGGDSLGTHVATQTLNMAAFNIVAVSSVNFLPNVFLASAAAADYGGVYVSSNIYVAGRLYGDGSGLTGIGGTLSGGQTPLLPYWTSANALGNSSLSQDSGGLTVIGSSFSVQGAFGVGGGTLAVNNARVGIGTVSPAYPLDLLNAGVPQARVGYSVNKYTTLQTDSGGHTRIIGNNNGNTNEVHLFNSGGAGYIRFLSNGGYERLRITDSGDVGISTNAPAYRLHVSSGAGETGTVMAVSTGASNLFWVAGDGAHAVKFFGDGSGLTNLAGAADNLGNHTATEVLKMGAYGVNTSSDITAARYQINGSTVLAVLQGAGNIGVGFNVGVLGSNNSSFGHDAGKVNTGGDNTFIGRGAGESNTSSTRNSFLGSYTGNSNTLGSYNSYLGSGAGQMNTTGMSNSVVGYNASRWSQVGSGNAVVGNEAGLGSSGNSYSSATLMGYRAGYGLLTGSDNIFLGWQAGYSVTVGTGNIVIGYNKDTSAPAASNELNIGGVLYGDLSAKTIGISTRAPQAALDIVSTGTANTQFAQIWRDGGGVIKASMSATGVMMATKFVGDGSGITGLPGGDNLGNHTATQDLLLAGNDIYNASTITATGNITAARYQINGSTVLALSGGNSLNVGIEAGLTNTGSSGVFLGYQAGYQNIGQANTFAGYNAGYVNSSGQGNTFVGSNAGQLNSVASNNSIVGYAAGYLGSTGDNNAIMGAYASYGNKTGSANAIFGEEAGRGVANNSFSSSTIVGYKAGFGLTTGSDNILLGWQAGDALTTGTRNIIVGYDQDTSAPSASNELNIGGVLYGNLSAKTIGISTRAPQAALDVVSTGTASNVYAQIWRDSTGLVVASMTATGVLYPAISGADDTKVAKTGDTMTGQLTLAGSTLTVTGSAFSVGGSTLSVVYGNVGIGTASPDSELAVQASPGQDGVNVTLKNDLGVSEARLSSWKSVGGRLDFEVGAIGAADMTILPGGSVGIGTASPAYRLVVSSAAGEAGNMLVVSTGTSNVIRMTGAGEVYANKFFGDGSGLTGISGDNLGNHTATQALNMAAKAVINVSSLTVNAPTSIPDALWVSTSSVSPHLYVSTGGRVGIGTAAPASALHIVSGSVQLDDGDGDGIKFAGGARVGMDNNGQNLTLETGPTNLRIMNNAATDTILYVTNSGKVGIGEYSPVAKLEVLENNTAQQYSVKVGTNSTAYHLVVSTAGKVGIGTASPGARLEVAGQVKITGGTPGSGKVLTSDADGLATWGTASGDNLGNHTATQTLNLAAFPVINVSSIAMLGDGLRISTSIYPGASGVFISAAGAIYTLGLGNGTAYPNARGAGAVDLQTYRDDAAQVASGSNSGVLGGVSNTAAGDYSAVAGGGSNSAAGMYAAVGGGDSNAANGDHSTVSGGTFNTAGGAKATVAGGDNNTVGGGFSVVSGGSGNTAAYAATVPGGFSNTAGGNFSFAAGFASSATAAGTFVWSDSQGQVTRNDVADRTLFKNAGGFMVTGSTNTTMAGTLNRGVLITGNGLVGISTGVPYAALDVVSTGTAVNQMAQLWRDGGGTIVSSMSATGTLMAAKFVGDGAALTNISANAGVYTLAQMETLAPAAAGRLISVSNASAPYSYCVSTGTAAGAWVLLNQTLHCR